MLVILEMRYESQKGTLRNEEVGSAGVLSSPKREKKGGRKNVQEKAGRKLNRRRSRWRLVG